MRNWIVNLKTHLPPFTALMLAVIGIGLGLSAYAEVIKDWWLFVGIACVGVAVRIVWVLHFGGPAPLPTKAAQYQYKGGWPSSRDIH